MGSILDSQNKIIEEFAQIDDWRDKYRAIIELGGSLKPYPEEKRADKYLIKECQNRAWICGTRCGDKVEYFADSEAQLVKGLIALAVEVYSLQTPQDILNTPADFIQKLALGDNLTRNRSTGLAGVISRIKQIALSYQLLDEHARVPPAINQEDLGGVGDRSTTGIIRVLKEK